MSQQSPRDGAILFYHGVAPERSDRWVERFLLSTDEFRRHLDVLGEQNTFVSLSALLDGDYDADGPPPLVLTFDDALRCFLDHGVPILEERGIPYLVAVPSGLLGSPRPLWSLELAQLILGCPRPALDVDLGGRRRRVRLGKDERRLQITEGLHFRLMQEDDRTRRRTLDSLRGNFTEEERQDLGSRNPGLCTVTAERLLRCDPTLVEFAVHGQQHIPLHEGEADAVLRRETFEARQELEHALGQSIDFFCFPYGIHSWPAMEALAGANYRAVLGTEAEAYRPEQHRGPLPLLPRVCGERPVEELVSARERGWTFPRQRTGPRWLTFPGRLLRRARRMLQAV